MVEGAKPELVRALGETYHADSLAQVCAQLQPDIVIECTGVGALVFEVLEQMAPDGIVCLTGVSSGGRSVEVEMAFLNKRFVLQNDVIFGSVNANRRHYEIVASALMKADPAWLDRLVTRRVTFRDWTAAFIKNPNDVKVALS